MSKPLTNESNGESPILSSIEIMKINSTILQVEEMEYEEFSASSSHVCSTTASDNIKLSDTDIQSANKKFSSPIKKKKQDCNLYVDSHKTYSEDAKDGDSVSPQPKKYSTTSKKKVKMTENQRDIRARAAEKRFYSSKKSPKKLVEPSQHTNLSPDLFENSSSNFETDDEKEVSLDASVLSSFNRLSLSNMNIPPIMVSPDHEVYVRLPLNEGEMPVPYPPSYIDVWDSKHVKMPNSSESLLPVKLANSKSKLVKRWPVICEALRKDINSVKELQSAILSYNSRYESRWRFDGLKYLIEEEFAEEDKDFFFKTILPNIIDLALNLPKIVTRPPILLSQKFSKSISLSQKQISSLLANAFLCTFPRRNARGSTTEYSSYPDINFSRLFFHKDPCALEKMKCIIHYFKEIKTREPDGMVTFSRQYISPSEMPIFEKCDTNLPKLYSDTCGLIEETPGLLQVDFANKYIGGGVLGLGCVQEEIRFVLCPELLVSMLFTEVLNKHEALIITGVEQYSKGRGYASSFEWAGSFHDVTLRDQFKRRLCQVVGIDALFFSRSPSQQFRTNLVMREIQKAYAGFHVLKGSLGTPIGIASGNWGCGAFRGDPKLKSLIQLVAAGAAGRDLAYFTFGDRKLRDDLIDIYQFLLERKVTVGQLVMILCQYGMARKEVNGKDLHIYIKHNLDGYDSDTDSESGTSFGGSDFKMQQARITGESAAEKLEPKSNVTPRCKSITDYFKPKPQSSFQKESSSVNETGTKPTSMEAKKVVTGVSISQEKLHQTLSACDELKNNSPAYNLSTQSTSQTCENKDNLDTKDDTTNTKKNLLDGLCKFDQKLS